VAQQSVITAVSNCHGIEPVATVKRWSSAQESNPRALLVQIQTGVAQIQANVAKL